MKGSELMRCQDAKQLLTVQREQRLTHPYGEREHGSDAQALQEHLEQCSECRTFEQEQHSIDALLKARMANSLTSQVRVSGISTDTIMRAVQQRQQIVQQFEALRNQQRFRVARLRKSGTAFAAIMFFALGSIPLLLLAITLVQTDLMVNALSFLSSVVDVFYVLGQYILAVLTVLTHNNLLLAAVAFAVVLMMGMWLRLMRPPHEA